MLFGWVEDEKYVDLIDEHDKVFRRFKNLRDYDEFCSRFSPADLYGLRKRETTVKWWESNRQLAKICAPIAFVAFCIYKALQ